MKAQSIRYAPSGEIELINLDVPEPGVLEVQVEGVACGICSWDIATCKLGAAMPVPAPAGHEGIGVVRKVGPGVSGLAEGDKVAGCGFQTVANRPAQGLWKLPARSDLPDHLWLVEPLSCAVTGLDTARLRVGDRVAVIGCGYMGLLLIQLLAKSYAARVVAIDINAERLVLAGRLGAQEAHHLGSVETDRLVEDLKRLELDIVFDTTGAQGGLDLAAKICRKGGQINLFGWIKGDTATFDPTLWHLGGFTVVNSAPTARVREVFPVAIRLLESGMVDMASLVTHVVPLPEYPGLMKKIHSGDPGYIKGVVTLAGSS